MDCSFNRPGKRIAMGDGTQVEPVPAADREARSGPLETSEAARPTLILLVDDQPVGLRALASVFENEHYELVLASCGADALSSIRMRRPALILLDVMMPLMDGFEVCRTIRATPATSDVPIILLTACDDREVRLEGLRSGANDLVTKPIDRAHLRALVQTIVRGKPPGSSRGLGPSDSLRLVSRTQACMEPEASRSK